VADVFVSYATQDRERAEQVVHAIIQSGWSVWIDRGLPIRSVAGNEIQEELARAKCVVVLWSHNSLQSTWVLNHARDAMKREAFLPLLIEAVGLPSEFAAFQMVDLSSWNGERKAPEFNMVCQAIRRVLDSSRSTRAFDVPGTPTTTSSLAEGVRRGLDPNAGEAVQRPAKSPSLFLCYRRNDTQHAADRLHERLVDTYGSDRVFMDIDSVPLGVNFVSYIEAQLQRCAAVLVLIGPHWTNAVDEEGHRRLDDPADHVRVEIAAALSSGVPVIPLMVQDAAMPRAKDLPENIRELTSQNGMPMPRAYWKESVERLIKRLEPLMSQRARPALPDKEPKAVDPLSAIHKLVESRDNRRLLICYPDHARLWATRVYERVVAAYGFRAVFRITDAQAPGPEHHTLDVSAIRGAIVLLTPPALQTATTGGSDDEFYETVSALIMADIPIVPVLIHGAAFPAPALLPEAIRPLAAMNAIRLEHTDWAMGAKQLLKELQPLMV